MKYLTSKKQIIIWLCFLLIFSPCLYFPIYRPQLNIKTYVVLAIYILGCFLLMAGAYWSYPELTNTDLKIRNVLYRFHKKSYAYDEIQRVVICAAPYHYPCLRIYLKSRTKPILHCIDSMSDKSVPVFIKELNSLGVVTIWCTIKK